MSDITVGPLENEIIERAISRVPLPPADAERLQDASSECSPFEWLCNWWQWLGGDRFLAQWEIEGLVLELHPRLEVTEGNGMGRRI